ncbi:MAG TPA: thioredoxin-disulfide reductase [Bacteroidales bacterium]|nr:MAG: thioredoxin-disulfide reductase [Bacteroidetes bacterium GWE2_42_24]OFY31097.1 MAG: thioredoxin-disulfide reductase [Bacteroidetes bacterium GWF2_43_11]HBZ66421.1 thioredoxin-disulfide reductase [Bacteroidales bacterium]
MNENIEKQRCLIIGSGPAGYTAAIYTGRADLKPLIYQGIQPGGQLTITTEVDNFPGYPKGITGPELMEDLKAQAERFGAETRWGSITEVDFSKRPFICKADDGKTIEAESVIIATGASARWLGIPSEQEFMGSGVSACATCDGYFYRGKVVAIVGGGDTACEEATYLAKLASKVYMIHRRDEFRASKAMQAKVFNTPNIEVIWNSSIKEIIGEKQGFMKSANGIIVEDVTNQQTKQINIDGLFIAIGHSPNADIFKGHIDLDKTGYIVTKPGTTQTSVEGVFAAGDVQDHHYRQAITAAGSGCMAAIEAERFLSSIQ